VHDDLYNGLRDEVIEATNILLGARLVGRPGAQRRAGRRHAHRRRRFPRRHPVRARGAAGRQRDEGRHGDPAPLLAETGVEPIGKMVIGTVKGDIHDIGKNLVGMMMEGAGFEVIDLGINNPVEKYLAALEEHKPDILGLSALLTTTMPYMKVVIDTLKEKGLRDDYIVLVGGAPLNEEFGKAVGADAYCRDAGIAVETAKTLIAARRAAR
jgi:methylmalonyl-CoA mutase cobalamin-binding domain/chain